ncbi:MULTISPECIES: M23 family metallopeptidase [Streptomyces]|uniref:M23 family metallopeptidase n=1 Tax=Streptomyces lycii TaxID=2654337 RepID=A0ABQ7FRT2_9ACTN|nr:MULTISPECIES: M23 family metallopeptidase [Streptomyces]KAF4410198.1 M23 family metallopeptidase [Streptomyces lycii]PGH48198.1 peptidase [Streptomyces sp. Ru87]
MALTRAAGKSGKHRRPSRRTTRSGVQAAGVATLATGGVVATLAGPALAADRDTGSAEDTGLHRAVVLTDTIEQRIGDQAEAQRSAAEEAAEQARAEAEAKRRAAEARRIADAREKEKERAAREAERKRLNTFVSPVAGSYVSTSYLASGSAWSSGSHTGVDFHAAAGTPVRSVGTGTVVEAGWDGSYGNSVVIKMNDGTYTQYGHLSSIAVSAGQQVTPAQQIGLAGNTGNSFGAHLHFEARTTAEYGSHIDPVAYLRSHGVSL